MSTKVDHLVESQKALKSAGLYTGKIDGEWGPMSHKALEEAIRLIPKTSLPKVSDPARDGYMIEVRRFKQSSTTTISEFTCNWNKIKGYMLEPAGPATTLANRNKRIPAGVYNLRPHTGARYKRVVNLYNEQVPASRAILIHQGNTAKDTVGCLIVGTNYSENYVGTSMAKLTELMDAVYAIGVEKVKLRITEQFK